MTSPTQTDTEAVKTLNINPDSMSCYLGLRHLPRQGMQWTRGVAPTLPQSDTPTRLVSSSEAILETLHDLMPHDPDLGILLSGGIDSAILAAIAPKGTPCFTISFDAPGAADESIAAKAYAARWEHPHHVVRVGWDHYEAHATDLMANKGSPLHAVEVPLHLAALRARELGVGGLLVGNGADSTFGGMDKLLCVDWSFSDFMKRYLFVDPALILKDPTDLSGTFAPYRKADGIDVQRFLREVHGQGIVQSFENAIHSAGLDIVAPYEAMTHDGALDLDRIRAGEPKYLLQQLFRDLYETTDVPDKVPFARPMDVWMAGWSGPKNSRREFRPDVATQLASMSGEARFLVWCLTEFVDQLERDLDA